MSETNGKPETVSRAGRVVDRSRNGCGMLGMSNQRDKTKRILLVMSGIAPCVGLLLTIVSLMRTFKEMSEADVIDAEEFSSSMWQGVMWTIAGVAVGVALLIVWIIVHRKTTADTPE